MVITSSCVAPSPESFRSARPQAVLDQPSLPFLLAANAIQLRRRIVGQRPIRLNLALDRLGQRSQAARERRRQLLEPRQFPRQPRTEARAAMPATRPRRWPASPRPAVPQLQEPRPQSAPSRPTASGRTNRPAESISALRSAAGPRPQADAGARSTPRRSRAAAQESPRAPTGDAANPATSASSGSHSSTTRSACFTGNGMGSTSGMSQPYGSVPPAPRSHSGSF